MNIVVETIKQAFGENLEAVFLLILCTAILYLINIVLGTILGANNIGFKVKKFAFGFLKGLIVSISIFAFCFVLNLLSLTLALVDIKISASVLTVLEVVGVLAIWDLDMCQEIFEKIKSLKELKYLSYEDINDYSVNNERG